MLKRSIFAGIVVLLSACSSSPDRKIFEVPPQSERLWEQIKSEAPTVQLKTLVTGQVQVPINGLLDMSDSKTSELTDKSRIVEVYAHWVRHPIKGDYLIDTGLDKRFATSPQGSLRGLISPWIIEDSFQEHGQDIKSLIRDNGIDIKGVFLTHIHGDHSSGIPEIPKGTPIIIGKGESLHQYPLIMYSDHFKTVETLYELDFQQGVDMPPLGKILDIFGDGSLIAISTPGHTRWGFEHAVIPGWSEDDALAKTSLAKLIRFAQENSDVSVIFGHER